MRQKYPGFKHKVRETKNKAVVEEDTIGGSIECQDTKIAVGWIASYLLSGG
jgi:hypothetical protein